MSESYVSILSALRTRSRKLNIPAKPVSKVGHRNGLHVGERDSDIDGDIGCDNKRMTGGFKSWNLAD